MDFRIVPHGGPDYKRLIALRERVLRTPLGLSFSARELDEEQEQIHCALYENAQPVACLAVMKSGTTIFKIRQMAVKPEYERKGLGKKLLSYVTKMLSDKGATMLYLHAREDAVGFYEKSGFKIDSAVFEEVGIPHYRMYRKL